MIVGRHNIEEGRAAGSYELLLLKDLDYNAITPEKISELWAEASQHSVLFSDYTDGRPEPFIQMFLNPGIFLELRKDGTQNVGLLYITALRTGIDAVGHFAFWDKVAGGREPLVAMAMSFVFEKYNLRRMSAEIPAYQKGVIRFIKRLGFQPEGVRRKSILYKGHWANQMNFGILREEFENEWD